MRICDGDGGDDNFYGEDYDDDDDIYDDDDDNNDVFFFTGGQDLWAVLHDAKISTTDIYGERMMMDRRGDDLLVGNMGEAKVQTGMMMEVVMIEN